MLEEPASTPLAYFWIDESHTDCWDACGSKRASYAIPKENYTLWYFCPWLLNITPYIFLFHLQLALFCRACHVRCDGNPHPKHGTGCLRTIRIPHPPLLLHKQLGCVVDFHFPSAVHHPCTDAQRMHALRTGQQQFGTNVSVSVEWIPVRGDFAAVVDFLLQQQIWRAPGLWSSRQSW